MNTPFDIVMKQAEKDGFLKFKNNEERLAHYQLHRTEFERYLQKLAGNPDRLLKPEQYNQMCSYKNYKKYFAEFNLIDKTEKFIERAAKGQLLLPLSEHPNPELFIKNQSIEFLKFLDKEGITNAKYDDFKSYLNANGLSKTPSDNISPLIKIDAILSHLNNAEKFSWKYKAYINRDIEIYISRDEIEEIINKLLKDGFVRIEETRTNESLCYSTFDGRLFEAEGGYSGRAERERSLITETNARNIRMERNETRLARWTVVLAIATIALVTWEIYQHYFSPENPFLDQRINNSAPN